jgi:hypothetical protein
MTEPKEVWVLEIPQWTGGTDIRYMYTEVYITWTAYLERVMELTNKGFKPIIRQVLTNTKYVDRSLND